MVLIMKNFLAQCSTVITANQSVRAGKVIELKKTVETALTKCTSVKQTFIMKRTDANITLTDGEVLMDEVNKFIII